MKKLFYTLALLCCVSLVSHAQPKNKKFERIEALRVEFISTQLKLTVEESKAFWPLYNEYKEAENKIKEDKFKKSLGEHPSREEFDLLTEKEVDEMMAEELKRQRALIDLRERYYQKFKTVLPTKKAALLFKAEHDFNRRLLRELRDRGGRR